MSCVLLMATSAPSIAQDSPCKRFIHGRFEEGTRTKQEILSGKRAGVRVLRRGRSQVETNFSTGTKVRYTIRWTDPCTFVLTDARVKRGIPERAWSPQDSITVTITQVLEHGYAYRRLSNFDQNERSGAMRMIVPQGFGIGFSP